MSIIIGNTAEKFISNFIGKRINSPEQRLIQGATAFAIQPFIDFNNKKADDKTRAVSVARTIGKIVAGTFVGVCIRYLCIYLARQFSRFEIKENSKRIISIKRKSPRDMLLPNFSKKFLKKITKEEFLFKYNNTTRMIGTVLATFSMIFTNFLVDARLTKEITKVLTPKVESYIKNNKNKEVKNGKIA